MTYNASIGKSVLIDVDGVPTHAVITHVDLTAFPREHQPRFFTGVHLHSDPDAAAADDHNLIASWPQGDEESVNEPDDELVDDDQVDEAPAAAPAKVAAKKAPAKKAVARR
jgi:hypothetical protein